MKLQFLNNNRANGKSFVCDVNGFSFVKNSNKYYDDCAKILGNMILRELTPTLHIPWSAPFQVRYCDSKFGKRDSHRLHSVLISSLFSSYSLMTRQLYQRRSEK